eukprot:COSAG06_NODE_16990_length_968_cov_1.341772_2_plen_61_part_01
MAGLVRAGNFAVHAQEGLRAATALAARALGAGIHAAEVTAALADTRGRRRGAGSWLGWRVL